MKVARTNAGVGMIQDDKRNNKHGISGEHQETKPLSKEAFSGSGFSSAIQDPVISVYFVFVRK